MSAWYALSPARYADGLRYNAAGCDALAVRRAAENAPWSRRDVERAVRSARRLRAMAALCDASLAVAASDVDFLGLNDPTQSREAEDAAIATIAERLKMPDLLR